jgi:agmatinase
MRPADRPMFGAPLWSPGERYDVVFVGVPSDLGSLGGRSPALGPAVLREQSALFPAVAGADGECVGWYDYTARRTLLRGARLADAGDFGIDPGRGPEALEALPAVYEALLESTRLLVVLGGDHSITYWLARALDGDGLVWLDAHEDATRRRGPYPHCGNVVSYIDSMPNVHAIAQLGLRGLVPDTRAQPPPHRVFCATPAEVVEALRARGCSSAAVTIDVDVLDPSVMPAVAAAMPGGLHVRDLLDVLGALSGAGVRVRALEIAELAPISPADAVPALSLVNFLLRAAATCLET